MFAGIQSVPQPEVKKKKILAPPTPPFDGRLALPLRLVVGVEDTNNLLFLDIRHRFWSSVVRKNGRSLLHLSR